MQTKRGGGNKWHDRDDNFYCHPKSQWVQVQDTSNEHTKHRSMEMGTSVGVCNAILVGTLYSRINKQVDYIECAYSCIEMQVSMRHIGTYSHIICYVKGASIILKNIFLETRQTINLMYRNAGLYPISNELDAFCNIPKFLLVTRNIYKFQIQVPNLLLFQ